MKPILAIKNIYSIFKAHNFFIGHMHFYRSFFNYHMLKALKKPTIRGIELAITYKCNFDCVYCSANDFCKEDEMSFNEICALLDAASAMGLCVLSITGGEPLLRNDVSDIIRYAKKKGISCTMFTNASLLTEEKAKKLKKAGLLRLLVTYYGGDEDSFGLFTKNPESFKRIQKNVEHAKKVGLHVSVQIVPTEEDLTNGGLERKIDFARKNGLTVNFNFPSRCGGWKSNKNVPLPQEKFSKVYELFNKTWVTNDTLNSLNTKRHCPAINRVVYITAQGDVIPCAYVPISWGNIRYKPLNEIVTKMQRSPVYSKSYDHCIAGENPDWVNTYIDPVYKYSEKGKMPMSVHSHPLRAQLAGDE